MSIKVALLLALTAVLVKADETNDICPCESQDSEKDNHLLWDLLKKLSKKIDNPKLTEEEQKELAVNPGILSPLYHCECFENTRRKRRVFKEQEKEFEQSEEEAVVDYNDIRCPTDHARIGELCVHRDFLQ